MTKTKLMIYKSSKVRSSLSFNKGKVIINLKRIINLLNQQVQSLKNWMISNNYKKKTQKRRMIKYNNLKIYAFLYKNDGEGIHIFFFFK